MKTLSLITLILLLTTPVFSQEIPFHKQPDKQIHFFSTLFILSPVFYTGAYKLTDGNKLKAALWSTLAVGVVGAGYELIHDKAMGKGDPSVGDFAAVMLGHVPILLTDVGSPHTIKAFAAKEDFISSAITTAVYTVTP